MNRTFLSALGFFITSSLIVTAQVNISSPTPHPPFINNAPTYEAWTITCTSDHGTSVPPSSVSAQGSPHHRTLKEIQITKMGKDRHELDLWSDGQTSEIWFHGKMILFTQPGSKDVYILDRSHPNDLLDHTFPDYVTGDFPELDWINLRAYVHPDSMQNHPCFLFQIPNTASQTPTKPVTIPTVEAWIDQETRLPVAIDDGDTRKVYVFHNLPVGTLQLPDRFMQALDTYNRAVNEPNAHRMKL